MAAKRKASRHIKRPLSPVRPAPWLRLALGQVAPALGDLDANVRLHLELGREAARLGADLVVFPELSLTGYRLQDLVSEVALPLDGRGPLRPLRTSRRGRGRRAGRESKGIATTNYAAHS
jgi:hypothetical protein